VNEWLSLAGVLGGVLAVAQFGYGVWKDRQGGALRKSQAEAAKATLDTAQAEASLPHVQESLRLGNVAEAVSIQQQVINGLREHAAWQDAQLAEAHAEVEALRNALAERDRQIDELEKRLGLAEDNLQTARRIIDRLRGEGDYTGGPQVPTKRP
jgi:DNA repair exonuclease SbcCD ATPase subunit